MERYEAIGLIETFGLVFVLEAADAMCKAADVELIGYENVASGYISVLVRGDVGACKTAVEAGVKDSNWYRQTPNRVNKMIEDVLKG